MIDYIATALLRTVSEGLLLFWGVFAIADALQRCLKVKALDKTAGDVARRDIRAFKKHFDKTALAEFEGAINRRNPLMPHRVMRHSQTSPQPTIIQEFTP